MIAYKNNRPIERNSFLIYDGHFLEKGADDGNAEPLDQEIHLVEQNETQKDDRFLLILVYHWAQVHLRVQKTSVRREGPNVRLPW